MNKFTIVFLTIIATLLFIAGMLYTFLQMNGNLPDSITGGFYAFIPFVCGATSIIVFGIVFSSKDTACCGDIYKEE